MFPTLNKKIRKFNEIVGFLNDIEKHFNESGINYRKDYLRPIIDILFEEEIKKNTLFKKTIENDLDIYFTLASRIGKDFLASPKKIPDHVNEPQTTELILRIAKKNKKKDVIFGGAYIGDMAIPVSKLFPNEASSKKLHCFEIDKSPLKLLKINISKNNIKNINVVKLALFDQDDVNLNLEMHADSLTSFSKAQAKHFKKSVPSKDNPENQVKTITLNTFCNSRKINDISVIHLDIEGGELTALKGANSLLSKNSSSSPDIIFEYCNFLVSKKEIHPADSDICQFLKSFGYHFYALRDFSSNIGKKLKNIEVIVLTDMLVKNIPHCFNIYATKNPNNIKRYKLKVCKGVHPKLMLHENKKYFWPLNK